MCKRLILFLILLGCGGSLFPQAWVLGHEYPLETSDEIRYAEIPDSLLRVFRSKEDLSLAQVRSPSALFTANPDELIIEDNDVIWCKGVFVNGGKSHSDFLIEIDPR